MILKGSQFLVWGLLPTYEANKVEPRQSWVLSVLYGPHVVAPTLGLENIMGLILVSTS